MSDIKIGLETHVQLDTNTKLFCSCPNTFTEDEPNTNVCEVCLGHPGSKPQLNKKVLTQSLKTGLALNCKINENVFFSRKTYFYPDMSKNYQITQYEIPVAQNGEITVKVEDREIEVRIKRVHIEEDPAKLKHKGGDISDSDYTLVDYNRSGKPLLEIVTKPDFKSPKEAREYLKQLEKMLEYLGLYESESEYSLKTDANISRDGGERVEVKNITGTKDIEKALSYEATRQKQMIRRGREVKQETRSYNQSMSSTQKLREKESERDYGYIFDPDLTRQELTAKKQREIEEKLPELPQQKYERFKQQYELEDKLSESLISESKLAEDFERLSEEFESKLVASWLTGDLKKVLNYNDFTYENSPVKLSWIKSILELKTKDEITDRNAEELLRAVVEESKSPETILEEKDLLKEDDAEIEKQIEKVLEKNNSAIKDYENGDKEALNFLVGQVMQETQGKADPRESRELIKQKLEE